jgi:hypothetical protein
MRAVVAVDARLMPDLLLAPKDRLTLPHQRQACFDIDRMMEDLLPVTTSAAQKRRARARRFVS